MMESNKIQRTLASLYTEALKLQYDVRKWNKRRQNNFSVSRLIRQRIVGPSNEIIHSPGQEYEASKVQQSIKVWLAEQCPAKLGRMLDLVSLVQPFSA